MALGCKGCRKENHTVKDCDYPATCPCQHRRTVKTNGKRKPVNGK